MPGRIGAVKLDPERVLLGRDAPGIRISRKMDKVRAPLGAADDARGRG